MPLPTHVASQWEAACNGSNGCLCQAGVHSRRGSGGSEESIASQAPSLSPSVFPASLSLLELTLARSRELPLNYLTLSHIGLLASGGKSFSEQSSLFFLSAFRWVPFSQSVSVSSWTLLRPWERSYPNIVTFFYKSPQAPALVGTSAEFQRRWERLLSCFVAVQQGSQTSELGKLVLSYSPPQVS